MRTHQVDHELDDLRHEFQVEEVRELVVPVAVHARVYHVEKVAKEDRQQRDEQNQELQLRHEEWALGVIR